MLDQTLKPGQQIAQCAHAIAEFSLQHSELFKEWHDTSNYICCLVANDLSDLLERCRKQNIKYTAFYEPDYNNQLTTICVEPTQLAKKLLSTYKLAPG